MKLGKFIELTQRYPWLIYIIPEVVQGPFIDIGRLQTEVALIEYLAFRPIQSLDWSSRSMYRIIEREGKPKEEHYIEIHLFWHFDGDQPFSNDDIVGIVEFSTEDKDVEAMYASLGGKANVIRLTGDRTNLATFIKDFPRWISVVCKTPTPFHFDGVVQNTLVKCEENTKSRFDIFLFPEGFKVDDVT